MAAAPASILSFMGPPDPKRHHSHQRHESKSVQLQDTALVGAIGGGGGGRMHSTPSRGDKSAAAAPAPAAMVLAGPAACAASAHRPQPMELSEQAVGMARLAADAIDAYRSSLSEPEPMDEAMSPVA